MQIEILNNLAALSGHLAASVFFDRADEGFLNPQPDWLDWRQIVQTMIQTNTLGSLHTERSYYKLEHDIHFHTGLYRITGNIFAIPNYISKDNITRCLGNSYRDVKRGILPRDCPTNLPELSPQRHRYQ